jgi:hypothetical protein
MPCLPLCLPVHQSAFVSAVISMTSPAWKDRSSGSCICRVREGRQHSSYQANLALLIITPECSRLKGAGDWSKSCRCQRKLFEDILAIFCWNLVLSNEEFNVLSCLRDDVVHGRRSAQSVNFPRLSCTVDNASLIPCLHCPRLCSFYPCADYNYY